MNIKDQNGTTVQVRTPEHKPQKGWRTWLIGNPLATADAPHQTIGKFIGLAVFSSDAMSSVAYGPQELMMMLAAAGIASLHFSLPLVLCIVALLAILTISYEQTIHAYPNGGGSYIVSRDNLGVLPAQIAGAALLTDYILTVAVSISSSVAQIASAFPLLYRWRIEIAVFFIMLIMIINLRGVKESGITFAIPTYFFILMMYITIIAGLVRYFTGTLGVVTNPPDLTILAEPQALTLFLLLKSFASGTASVTGVEAISDGITAFREPRSKNAGTTLIMMAAILGSMLIGVTFLAGQVQAIPSEHETLVSQIARTVFDSRGLLYLITIIGTTVILVMAANTAFADFPRLGAITAKDGFLPRQLTFRGSRLVYSRGIAALAIIASLLIILFKANVSQLIPLYAIGVFLSFTLSQSGMARRWWKSGHLKPGEDLKEQGSTLKHENNWQIKMIINGFGAVVTFFVTIIFAVTKFADGAWVVVVLLPVLVVIFYSIHHHYVNLASHLSLDNYAGQHNMGRHRVILLLSGVHRGTLAGLKYAESLSDDVTAVHVSIDEDETAKVQQKWESWGDGIRLVILDSPYRLLIEPLLDYIQGLNQIRLANEMITIVVPHFVPRRFWTNTLHMRTADTLRKVLMGQKDIVIVEVPYQVD
ncbi:MAG: permease [Chloroflexi bacterium HGW-Chloroflexi-8]|nr:MAG: permease [Chloroflexi bacterium HGW-Chloroflexi-8]